MTRTRSKRGKDGEPLGYKPVETGGDPPGCRWVASCVVLESGKWKVERRRTVYNNRGTGFKYHGITISPTDHKQTPHKSPFQPPPVSARVFLGIVSDGAAKRYCGESSREKMAKNSQK